MAIRAVVPERVERLCDDTLDVKPLREQLLVEIRRAVPFDAHVWLLTDPVSRVGTSPLADVPGLTWSRLPHLTRQRYLSPVNRWTDLMDTGSAVASLHETTGGELAASDLWREAQRPLGVVDAATVVFWDRFGCWGWLELWRYAPAAPFTSAELGYLGALADPVAAAVRRAQARTFVHTGMDPPDAGPEAEVGGPAVLVLAPDLQVRVQTKSAAEALHRLNPPDDSIPVIPAAAYNVAAALVAQEHGVPLGPPCSRIHLGHGRWLTLRASRISPTGSAEGDIAVSIAASTPSERREVFALAHGLSRRERQILSELATGADTGALARRLVISAHTVNDHVKAILAKTGATTRHALLSRIAGTG